MLMILVVKSDFWNKFSSLLNFFFLFPLLYSFSVKISLVRLVCMYEDAHAHIYSGCNELRINEMIVKVKIKVSKYVYTNRWFKTWFCVYDVIKHLPEVLSKCFWLVSYVIILALSLCNVGFDWFVAQCDYVYNTESWEKRFVHCMWKCLYIKSLLYQLCMEGCIV